MTYAFAAEIILEVLLAATLCYCIILERRLAAVRRGQEGLKTHIGELNMAIAGAGASLRALKAAAGEAAATLDERLKRARLHIDELSVLTASGERIANRMEYAAAQRGGMETAAAQRGSLEGAAFNRGLDIDDLKLPSNSIMNRLNTARASQ
jgi:hypothetical protein